MWSKKTTLALVIILAIIVIAVVAYQKGWLNRFLPSKWGHKSGFVGAYGRTPEMQGCLAFPGALKRWSNFNRCTWV
jgi:hypothetical protein